MADISTAVSMARVPILGENGRISDDYIPAAIGENATKAESAATRAESAATDAEGSASAASQSATQASGSASAANASATQAQQSATTAGGAATSAQSAQTAAEAAKTAAETAQSAAAGSAHDAQQSATAAQQSAASVADKFIASAQATTLEPGSQATASVADQVLTIGVPKGDKGDKGDQGEKGDTGTGVPDGGTPGQLLSKTADGTAWVDPPSGNVLTGETEGYVAHGEDAYAQKPREVRIKGKTWVNRWPVISGTSNGVTVSTDDTGLITVSGASTTRVGFTSYVYSVAANKSVTVKISSSISGVSINVQSYANGEFIANIANVGSDYGNRTEATGVVSSNATRLACEICISADTTVNASFRVMLVDGTEAPDCFTPPASIASVETGKLVTSGKNLLPPVSEWDTSDQHYNRYIVNPFPIGTQLVGRYGGNPSGLVGNVRLEFRENYDSDDYSKPITSWNDTSVVGRAVTVTARDRYISIVTAERADAYFDQMQFQLELGSTATSYEPPNITQTPLPEVELRSLPNGTCDELVIKSDGTCEVKRRTEIRVLDGVENAVTAVENGRRGRFGSFTAKSAENNAVNNELICSGLPSVSGHETWGGTAYGVSVSSTGGVSICLDGIDTVEGYNEWLQENPQTLLYIKPDSADEPQSPVTLPALPAPTFNQYHDAGVPSDTSTEYVRDINIAFSELQAQISATTVREATNG